MFVCVETLHGRSMAETILLIRALSVTIVLSVSFVCVKSKVLVPIDSSAELENDKNTTDLTVVQNLPYDSTHPRPETEEDLVAEMEDLFKAMRLLGYDFERNSTDKNTSVTARMKMSDFMFNPYMLIPQLITWGFAPIILANMKMFVMQALMLNKMALNAAIFMTLRNIVFGPRPGPVVKYANYGYQNKFHHYHRRRS